MNCEDLKIENEILRRKLNTVKKALNKALNSEDTLKQLDTLKWYLDNIEI